MSAIRLGPALSILVAIIISAACVQMPCAYGADSPSAKSLAARSENAPASELPYLLGLVESPAPPASSGLKLTIWGYNLDLGGLWSHLNPAAWRQSDANAAFGSVSLLATSRVAATGASRPELKSSIGPSSGHNVIGGPVRVTYGKATAPQAVGSRPIVLFPTETVAPPATTARAFRLSYEVLFPRDTSGPAQASNKSITTSSAGAPVSSVAPSAAPSVTAPAAASTPAASTALVVPRAPMAALAEVDDGLSMATAAALPSAPTRRPTASPSRP